MTEKGTPSTVAATALMAAILVVVGVAVAAVVLTDDPSGSAEDAAPTPPPIGSTYRSTEVTGVAIPGGGPLEIVFPESGRVSMTAGCNRHMGEVTVEGSTMTFGALASTMMACAPPRDGADSWLADFASAPLRWHRDGTALTLTSARSTVVLTEVD
ncbi:META domain-containing protein [Gordonia sp. NB41Y]|uniref:META domain-containing protein n=1 Tax=Gordonia sp. NB41Y TaxID=875808 RepID=UPI0002BDB168|nr:META domain-containing protein [Gordonia sp. NB41Y]WLP90628.1 META domain-containing protein [Gordonia sp. NB41Y]